MDQTIPLPRQSFFSQLRSRNPLLYWFGWYNLVAGIICIAMIFLDDMQLLGINRWIKPAKFFISVALMIWTMGWLLHYLNAKKKVLVISWLLVISMFFENAIIALQAYRGVTSHFNVTSNLNGMLFSLMGIFIILFAVTVLFAIILYFRQKTFAIPDDYLWGIRLGLILFLFFSLEGGMMLTRSSHTVGAADGGPGLPFVNWSSAYGDLRIAHFMGLHALQILPLSAYYLFRTKKQVIVFGIIYFIVVFLVLLQAFLGMPLIKT